MTNETEEYDIGYGKPPVSGQFKPGQSGNPKGRPKVDKSNVDFRGILYKVLGKNVEITEKGRPRKIMMFEAILTQHATKAAKGHNGSFNSLIKLTGKEPITSQRAPLPWTDDF